MNNTASVPALDLLLHLLADRPQKVEDDRVKGGGHSVLRRLYCFYACCSGRPQRLRGARDSEGEGWEDTRRHLPPAMCVSNQTACRDASAKHIPHLLSKQCLPQWRARDWRTPQRARPSSRAWWAR